MNLRKLALITSLIAGTVVSGLGAAGTKRFECPQLVHLRDKQTPDPRSEKLLVDTRLTTGEKLEVKYVGVATGYFESGMLSPELPDDPEADKEQWSLAEGADYYFVCAISNGTVYAERIDGYKRCLPDKASLTCE